VCKGGVIVVITIIQGWDDFLITILSSFKYALRPHWVSIMVSAPLTSLVELVNI
jgi:hypothetical protein